MPINYAVESIAPTRCDFLFGSHFLPPIEVMAQHSIVMGELILPEAGVFDIPPDMIPETSLQDRLTGVNGSKSEMIAHIHNLKYLFSEYDGSVAFLDGQVDLLPPQIARRYNDYPVVQQEHLAVLSAVALLITGTTYAATEIVRESGLCDDYQIGRARAISRRRFLGISGKVALAGFAISAPATLISIAPGYLKMSGHHNAASKLKDRIESFVNLGSGYREDFGSVEERIVQMRNVAMAHNFNAINNAYDLSGALFFAGQGHAELQDLVGFSQLESLNEFADRLVEVTDSLQREFTQKGYPLNDIEYIVQTYLKLFGDYRILREDTMNKKTDSLSGSSARYVFMNRIIQKINDERYSPIAREILRRSMLTCIDEDRKKMSGLRQMFPNLNDEYYPDEIADTPAQVTLEECDPCIITAALKSDQSNNFVFCGIARDGGITIPVYRNLQGALYGMDKKGRVINPGV